MTDHELLKAAAKAAGVELAWSSVDGQSPRNVAGWNTWNPLDDDGDALRLAVKLGVIFKPEFTHFLSLERFASQDKDHYTAYRRAIVRAAIAIGEG